VLLDGLAMPESPRWHNGRLWFSHWGADEIIAVDLDGHSEVIDRAPQGLGWAVNWLPDGRMLVAGNDLVRVEPDRSRVRHADLSHISPYGWSEITVDGRGNVYVNTINFDFADFDAVLAGGQALRKIALVTPDGQTREVADQIAFPNGMVVTPDNKSLIIVESFAARLTAFDIAADGTLSNRKVWADGVGPDGICLDADGCIWASSGAMTNDCARIREGGQVLDRIELDCRDTFLQTRRTSTRQSRESRLGHGCGRVGRGRAGRRGETSRGGRGGPDGDLDGVAAGGIDGAVKTEADDATVEWVPRLVGSGAPEDVFQGVDRRFPQVGPIAAPSDQVAELHNCWPGRQRDRSVQLLMDLPLVGHARCGRVGQHGPHHLPVALVGVGPRRRHHDERGVGVTLGAPHGDDAASRSVQRNHEREQVVVQVALVEQ
jgi:sugar lactone lactonase YvrE